MNVVISERYNRASHAPTCHNLVAGLEFTQHLLPLLLLPLLRHDQQKIKDAEYENQGRKADPTQSAASLKRQ